MSAVIWHEKKYNGDDEKKYLLSDPAYEIVSDQEFSKNFQSTLFPFVSDALSSLPASLIEIIAQYYSPTLPSPHPTQPIFLAWHKRHRYHVVVTREHFAIDVKSVGTTDIDRLADYTDWIQAFGFTHSKKTIRTTNYISTYAYTRQGVLAVRPLSSKGLTNLYLVVILHEPRQPIPFGVFFGQKFYFFDTEDRSSKAQVLELICAHLLEIHQRQDMDWHNLLELWMGEVVAAGEVIEKNNWLGLWDYITHCCWGPVASKPSLLFRGLLIGEVVYYDRKSGFTIAEEYQLKFDGERITVKQDYLPFLNSCLCCCAMVVCFPVCLICCCTDECKSQRPIATPFLYELHNIVSNFPPIQGALLHSEYIPDPVDTHVGGS